MNAIVKKLHPYSKTINVTNYWSSGDDEVCLCYNRRFDGYNPDYLDAKSIANILGYKKVTINKGKLKEPFSTKFGWHCNAWERRCT
jgi:hypothetical protein